MSTKKLQAMEDIFAELKQVTGVSSLDDMLEKFASQRNNKRELDIEGKDANARNDTAKKALEKKNKEFQDSKSSGVGMAELSRDQKDK